MMKELMSFRKKTEIEHNKKEDISIEIQDLSDNRMCNSIITVFISIISLFCAYLGFSYGFNISANKFAGMFAIVGFSFVVFIIVNGTKNKKIIALTLAVIFAGVVLIAITHTVNGISLISNEIISYINEHKAESHLKYVVSVKNKSIDMALGIMVICAIYTVVFNICFFLHRYFFCAYLVLGASVINLLFNGEQQTVWIALSLLCVLVLFYSTNIYGSHSGKKRRFEIILLTAGIVMSAVFVLAVDYNGIRYIDDLKDDIKYNAGNIIYGKSDYPEGQFKRFDKVDTDNEEIRIVAEMTEAVPLHLKGYVGCQYTSKGWTDNKENIYGGQNQGMIEWFLEQGFFPLIQPAFYMGYSRNEGDTLDFNKIISSDIHITNQSASKKYEYVPENLMDMSGLIDPKQDVNFIEQDLFGEKEYLYDILYYKDGNYLEFPRQNWFESDFGNTEDESNFKTAENYYHGFVSEYYLDIPDEEREILKNSIPTCNNNVRDAVYTVRNYLKNQIEYSEDVSKYNPDNNYLRQIMIDKPKGISPHFATIATLMFRYYGVPARYVEGYLVPNTKRENLVEITAKDAHAWVEVYIAGLGFVPVEVTPGFYEEDNNSKTITQDNQQQKQDENNSGGGSRSNNDDKKTHITFEMLLSILIKVLAVIVFILVLFIMIRRFIVVSVRKKKMKSEDDYIAVATASRYMEHIYSFVGLNILDELPDDIREILERIKFSTHPLKENERDKITECTNNLVKEKWSEISFGRKMSMMFLKCLK
ncbi:MAG: hypothetical protein E7254_04325 [Lachnospiraceae bacterium]|nr:hypothetical protein [Lachnospiraceae bacterium]